jgi:3-oxoacyl-[acyl-carrier protein] reductase
MGVLDGRAAIVTAGGGPGMGRSICLALADEGAAVTVADVDLARAERVAAEIEAGGGRAIAVAADVSNAEAVEQMTAACVDAFGSVGVLVNHAGVWPGGPIEAITEEVWDRSIGVHLTGAFLCSRAAVPHMRAKGWGRIVSTASRAAFRQVHGAGVSDYAAAKAGLVGFSRALAMEVGEWGVTVNVVAPGQVLGTGMLGEPATLSDEEQARLGKVEGQVLPPRHVRPDEIAQAVIYLVGPYSDRVTGTVLHVNGGSYFPA